MGRASGKDKAQEAANMAIYSPLIETSIKGAMGIIISISASPDIGLDEIDHAANMIRNEANPDANLIWGATFDETLEDEMKITIIATGFENPGHNEHRGATPAPAAARANANNQPQRNAAPQQKQAAPAPTPAPGPAAQEEPVYAPQPAPAPAPAPQHAPQPAPAPAAAAPKAPQGGDSFDDIMKILRTSGNRGDFGSGNGRR